MDKAKEFNIVLIGDGGVGKTSYVKRFVSPEYDKENQMPTEKVEVHPLMLEKRTEGEAAVQGQEVASGSKKLTPGEIRIQKDIAEFDGDNVAMIEFLNPVDSTRFQVTITPDSGFWLGATYTFTFEIPDHYPHSPPKVTCQTKIYHPNISLDGTVCLNILKEDYWRPVADINTVTNLLIYLFDEPDPQCPLNYEAAELFCKDVTQFKNLVKTTLRGDHVEGVMFPRFL